MLKWTNEQKQAIVSKNKNILISAAAGSGKTAVLVERIINMITDENLSTGIDRLLIVTFTNAAATEMRERIGKALADIIKKFGNSSRIQEQYILLQKAKIMTIHSFCNEVVRDNFQLLDLDPNFQIAEETEIQLIKQEAVDELLEKKYEDKNPLFIKFSNVVGNGRDHNGLIDIILNTYNFIQSFPWPFDWLEEKLELLISNESFEKTLWGKTITRHTQREIERSYNELLIAKQVAQEVNFYQYVECLNSDLEILQNLKHICNDKWDNIVNLFCKSSFSKLKPIRSKEYEQEKEYIKDIRNSVKKRVEKIKTSFFNRISQEISANLKNMHPYLKVLSLLVEEFDDIFKSKKRNRNLLDFNDLEHYCLNILAVKDKNEVIEPTDAAVEYTQQFDEIFIDEYQDSNMVQEIILSTISGNKECGPSRFMVGDVKQSIYKFRQAEPKIFMKKYATYSNNPKHSNYRILLNKNFRSSRDIVDGVNYIFRQIMNKETAEVEYTQKEELVWGSNTITHIPNYFNIINLTENELSDNTEDIDVSYCEGKKIALTIKELVEQKSYEYKDIVILLRSMSGNVENYIEQLANENIPSYADMGEGFLKTTEIQIIISLLTIIDNPRQDIPLVAVMRSKIFGFTPDELMVIRQYDSDDMYKAIEKYPENGDDLWIKCNNFIKTVDKWRKKAFELPIDELIYYLYTETGYYNFVGTLPNGRQRQANLNMLFEKARMFDKTTYKGLFNFINYIENLKTGKYDMGSATILGENDNVVRIMTIHKSKGLEFPVVILGGLGKKFNYTDSNKKILFHREYGFGPDFIDPEYRITYPTISKKAIQLKIREETAAEEMRILYVALTRAKTELYLIGTVKDLERRIAKWSQVFNNDRTISPSLLLNCDNYLDWIGMSLIRHADGKRLREEMSTERLININCTNDKSNWVIEIINFMDMVNIEKSDDNNSICTDEFLNLVKSDKYKKDEESIKGKLEWNYEFQNANKVPKKISVTELKRLYNMIEENTESIFKEKILKRPSFVKEEKGLTPAEKGTALHTFLQHLNFKETKSIKDIDKYKNILFENNILSSVQIESIDSNKVLNFMNSKIGKRIKSVKNVYKEIPFTITISGDEIYSAENNEEILVQGIVDCYFEEDGKIVLVDYKTDYIKDNNENTIRKRYGIQMNYYAMAIEKITKMEVKEKYIYLFNNNKTVKI